MTDVNGNPRARAIAWAREVLADPAAVVLDTETSGLGPDAEICDLAILGIDGRILVDTLVLPLNAIPAEATAVHGITVAMCERAKAPMWRELWPRVATILHPGRRVIVYNADYDFGIVQQVTAAAKLPAFAPGWQCAMRAYSDFDGTPSTNPRRPGLKWFKLGEAASRFGIAVPHAHRALADCLTTLAVVRAMAECEPVPEQAELVGLEAPAVQTALRRDWTG